MARLRARMVVVSIVIDSNEYKSLVKIDAENITKTIYIDKKYDGNIKSTKMTDI